MRTAYTQDMQRYSASLLRVSFRDPEVQLREMFGPRGTHQLYCDMDGVLVGFSEAYLRAVPAGIPPMGTPLDPAVVREASFWSGMGWEKGGREIWEFIKDLSPIILTANPSYKGNPDLQEDVKKGCEAGKREWVASHLHPTPEVVVERHKHTVMDPAKVCVLIDDMDYNLKDWKAAGGIPIRCVTGSAHSVITKILALMEVPK